MVDKIETFEEEDYYNIVQVKKEPNGNIKKAPFLCLQGWLTDDDHRKVLNALNKYYNEEEAQDDK